MRKITFLVLFLSTLWGYSQVRNYTFTQSTTTPYPELTGATTTLGNTTTNDQFFVNPDIPSGGSTTTGAGFDIGFPFGYNGITYDKFGVQANGWIALGSSAYTPSVNMGGSGTSYDKPLAISTAINPTALGARIAPLAINMQAGTNPSIQFQLGGTAPNRFLTIQWKNYKRGSGDVLNFQVVLHETTNTVDFVYGSFTAAASTAPQVGMVAEPVAGAYSTNFINRGSGTPLNWNNTINGTNVNNSVALQSGTIPVSGLMFTWTPPTCNEPKNLSVSAITSNGATLSWSSYLPAPGGYEYIYSTSATLPTGIGTATPTASAAVTDLTPGTKYYVFVRSACGTQFTNWINVGTFKTRCLDVPAYTENFDSYTAGAGNMPTCWFVAGNGTTNINTGGASPGTAPNRLIMTADGSLATPTVAYAILPPVSNLQSGTYRLKFKAYATTANKTFDVGYFTNIDDPSTFTSLQTINLPSTTASTAQEFIVVPPTTIPEGVKNLVFKNAGTVIGGAVGPTTLYIDDVIWQKNVPCTDLLNVLVKSPSTNSVNLSWDVTGTETAWQYVVAPSTVTDPSTLPAESIIDVTSASVTIDNAFPNTRTITVGNLTLNTSYKIWVRSKCSATAFGLWAGSPVFATPCTPVAVIAEDFDANTTVPDCWNKLNSNGSISIAPSMGTASSNALKLTIPITGSDNAVWLGLPPVTTPASSYRLKFKYRGNSSFFTLQIVSLQDPLNIISSAPANFTVLDFGKQNPVFAAKDIQYAFSGIVSGSSPYLALKIYSSSIYADTVYIDDLVWEPVPVCPDVKSVGVNAMSGESVTLGWTGSGTEGDWQYALGSSVTNSPGLVSAVDFSMPFINGNNITASIAGLTPSTSYKIWIRSKCDTSFGSWIGPIYIKTNCPGVESFNQNFDSSLDFPACWASVGGVKATVVNQAGISLPNILKIDRSATDHGIVVMQPVTNAADGTHVLKFRLKGSVVKDTLQVGYMTNPSDPTKFRLLKKVPVTSKTEFSTESVDLGFEPASQVLAFRNAVDTLKTVSTIYIDDVIWDAVPACSDVSNVAITGVSSTTVGLSWIKGGTEATWQYAITDTSESDPKKLPFSNFSGPVVDDANVASAISGLLPSTSYKVWVRSRCSTAVLGSWIGPYVFSTTCPPTDGKIAEHFDVNTNLPACWIKVGTAGTVAVTATSGGSNPNALTLVSSATAKAVVALPPVTNAGAGTYRLRFKFKSSVANSNIQIGYVTNTTDSNSFVLRESFAATAKDLYYDKTVFMGTDPTSELLAFKNLDASTIMIDDVFWEPVPTCLDVSEVSATKITSNSVELGWKPGGVETAWQYALGAATVQNPDLLTAVDFVEPVGINSNIGAKINNLTPATSYNIWVRSNCSSSGNGVWIGPYSFSTTCAPTSQKIVEKFDLNANLPACWTKVGTQGNVAVVSSTITGGTSPNALKLESTAAAKAVVALPPVTNAGADTYILRFKFRSSAPHTSIQIGYLTNITDPGSFTLLQTFAASAKDVYYSRFVLPGSFPTSELLAIRNPDACIMYIDDVTWEAKPACADVSNLLAVKSSSNTVDLNWQAGGSETAWQYVLGASTDENPDLLSPVNFVNAASTESNVVGKINNLTPATSYRVWVRAKCSDSSFSPWSDKASFATNCSPIESFSQNFDASNDFPACWGNVGGGNVSVINSSDPVIVKDLFISNSPSSSAPVVAMPAVSNATAGTHRLKFKFKVTVMDGVLEVGYLKLWSDPNSFVTLQSFTNSATGVYMSAVAQWNNTQVTEVLAFRHPGLSSATTSVIVDDVIWEPIPVCADIKALAVKSVKGNAATFTWTAGGSESKWQYVKGASTDTDPAALTAVDVSGSAKEVALNNLDPTTTYKVWVRSKCDDGTIGLWVGPLTITTPCASVSEIAEDFQGTNPGYLPSCWKKVGNQGTVSVSPPTGNMAGPGNTLYLNMYSSDASSLAVAAMPPMTNISDGTLSLSFRLAGSVTSAGLEVGYLTDITDPTSFVKISTVKTTAANTYQPQTVKIGVLPAEAMVLAFRSTAASVATCIDDLYVGKELSGVLGMDSFDDINFSYYPNPVRDILNLTLGQEINNVTVCNLLGQQMIKQSVNGNNVKIDLSVLSGGTYLVKVVSGNQSKTIKVIKE